jgi:hypothetical protein
VRVLILFDDEVPVHYGFIFVSCAEDQPDLMETRAGQRNGLCGAAVPGVLSLITGLHTGEVPFTVQWHDAEPSLDAGWEDVVEASFTTTETKLALTSFQDYFELELPFIGSLRARYCATGMDAAHQRDTRMDGEPAVDRYLLAFWPADPADDAIVRQTSRHAAYWHREAQAVRLPSAEERAAEARARAEQERQQKERLKAAHEERLWGGRRPSPRLRELGGNVIAVARKHRELLDAFEALDADTQRAAARWLARQAFELAELDRLDWVRPALEALDRGLALPEPFTDTQTVFALVRPSGELRATATLASAERPAPRRIHRPSFAVPAIFGAVHPDPLQALVDAFSHSVATFNEREDELISGLRERFLSAGRSGSSA